MLNIFLQLIRDTRSQKLRTLLTLFGMIWGTAAVSLLLAFGDGLHKQLLKDNLGIGNNVVIGWPARTAMPFEGLAKGRYIKMEDSDILLIRRKAFSSFPKDSSYLKMTVKRHLLKSLEIHPKHRQTKWRYP